MQSASSSNPVPISPSSSRKILNKIRSYLRSDEERGYLGRSRSSSAVVDTTLSTASSRSSLAPESSEQRSSLFSRFALGLNQPHHRRHHSTTSLHENTRGRSSSNEAKESRPRSRSLERMARGSSVNNPLLQLAKPQALDGDISLSRGAGGASGSSHELPIEQDSFETSGTLKAIHGQYLKLSHSARDKFSSLQNVYRYTMDYWREASALEKILTSYKRHSKRRLALLRQNLAPLLDKSLSNSAIHAWQTMLQKGEPNAKLWQDVLLEWWSLLWTGLREAQYGDRPIYLQCLVCVVQRPELDRLDSLQMALLTRVASQLLSWILDQLNQKILCPNAATFCPALLGTFIFRYCEFGKWIFDRAIQPSVAIRLSQRIIRKAKIPAFLLSFENCFNQFQMEINSEMKRSLLLDKRIPRFIGRLRMLNSPVLNMILLEYCRVSSGYFSRNQCEAIMYSRPVDSVLRDWYKRIHQQWLIFILATIIENMRTGMESEVNVKILLQLAMNSEKSSLSLILNELWKRFELPTIPAKYIVNTISLTDSVLRLYSQQCLLFKDLPAFASSMDTTEWSNALRSLLRHENYYVVLRTIAFIYSAFDILCPFIAKNSPSMESHLNKLKESVRNIWKPNYVIRSRPGPSGLIDSSTLSRNQDMLIDDTLLSRDIFVHLSLHWSHQVRLNFARLIVFQVCHTDECYLYSSSIDSWHPNGLHQGSDENVLHIWERLTTGRYLLLIESHLRYIRDKKFMKPSFFDLVWKEYQKWLKGESLEWSRLGVLYSAPSSDDWYRVLDNLDDLKQSTVNKIPEMGLIQFDDAPIQDRIRVSVAPVVSEWPLMKIDHILQ